MMMFLIATAHSQTTGSAPAAPPAKPAAVQPAPAAVSGDMVVSRSAIALDIVEHEPVDTSTSFPPTVKRLYCFTEIKNGDGREIEHRWYWNDDMLNSVSLGITSNRHRTYSAKTIVPGMVGEWRVAVVDKKNDAVLKMINFTVK
jgi:hypothetical protein